MSSGVSEFKPLLGQSVGYGVVVGVGFFFAAVMLVLTFLQSRFSGISPSRAEEFSSASRSVKPGLVCCGIVSAWTWSATLLQSSTAAYTFGISGPWWYGVGGTIQLGIFGMIAAKVKMNANGAHTFLEIVKARFGVGPHILFTFYGFVCNLIVSGSLLLGGAATVNALTGMDINAACMLLPIGIAVYVVFGGLRATFICDWSHTIILFVIIFIFLFKTYVTAPELGSIDRMYELLVQAAVATPVDGNEKGSYLTMASNQGLVFGAATILSGFAGVFCDQGYWQRAIASAPESTTEAYMLGGLSWFAVPWAFASCLGLAARALLNNPNFPTYPNPLSDGQVSAGLAAPAASATLMGKGGAVAILLVVFMAVTSAASAELIAVSSLFSYDVYKEYIKPNITGPEIVRVSHLAIAVWAIWMGCWAVILNKASIDLGWVIISGTLTGTVLGMLAWMIGCLKIYGEINVANLAKPYSAVASGLAGLLFSGIVTVAISLIKPGNYDFSGTRNIAMDNEDRAAQNALPYESKPDDVERSNGLDEKEKDNAPDATVTEVSSAESVINPVYSDKDPVMRQQMQRVFKRALWASITLTAIIMIIVPLPMYFSRYIFSPKFYTFWVVCTFLWAFASGTFCIILPLWESRIEMKTILQGAYRHFIEKLAKAKAG
ncbi:Na+/solute symporter [Amylostereum chailletii]|nr:Na+/solute symporter [Amylostereum chailletii]